MGRSTPLSPRSHRVPVSPFTNATEDALNVARQAQHVANPTLPLIGFSNGLEGYGNACFRNALISVLINLPPFSGWVVSDTQGQLDSSPTAHLLEHVIREYFATNTTGKQARADGAIQRLYNYFNIARPINPTNLTFRYPESSQQDAVEVLGLLMNDIGEQLRDSSNGLASDTFAALTEFFTAAKVECGRCRRATHREPDGQDISRGPVLRTALTANTSSFTELIRNALIEAQPGIGNCRRCGTVTPRRVQWTIVRSPEVLLIDVYQGEFRKGHGFKPGYQVPPIPEELDLSEYLHEVAISTSQYRLCGVVNHSGTTPDRGHYTSHVRHPSGNWFLLDDSTVSPSSVANLQKYDPKKRAGQMIPRLIAYVKIDPNEDKNAIAMRTAKLQPGPRAFKHPQIIYDDKMTLGKLKKLCKERHGLLSGNVKSKESMRKLINNANSADSNFTTRLKDWLITTLLSTGTIVPTPKAKPLSSKKKEQLVAQLKSFLKNQPKQPKPSKTPPGSPRRPTPLPSPRRTLQELLDAANGHIAELEQNVTDLQRQWRLPIATSDDVMMVIQRLPTASPNSTPRGSKRAAEGEPDEFEISKRRIIHLARVVCESISNEQVRRRNGPRRDSDEENQQPPRNSGVASSPHGIHDLRCHRCPTIQGQIHHMHANVCTWANTRTSPLTPAQIDEFNAENANRPPTRRPTEDDDEGSISHGGGSADDLPEDGDETINFFQGQVEGFPLPPRSDRTERFLESGELTLHGEEPQEATDVIEVEDPDETEDEDPDETEDEEVEEFEDANTDPIHQTPWDGGYRLPK